MATDHPTYDPAAFTLFYAYPDRGLIRLAFCLCDDEDDLTDAVTAMLAERPGMVYCVFDGAVTEAPLDFCRAVHSTAAARVREAKDRTELARLLAKYPDAAKET